MSRRTTSPLTSKLGVFALWLLFLLVPIVFSRTANESFRLPKLLLAESLGLLSLLLLSLRLRSVDRIDWRTVVRQPVVLAVLPILAVASLGLITSPHPMHVREALVSLWIGVACLVGWNLALSEREHLKLLRGLIVPASALSVAAVLQFHGLYTPFQFEGNVGERIGLTSFAGGAFDLATYLVLPSLLAQAGMRRATSKKQRWAWAAAAVFCVYAMVATQTLTALLAFAAGCMVLWFAWLPRRRFVAFAAGIALVAIILGVGFAPLRQRIDRKLDSLLKGDINQVLTGRLDGWRAALWMVQERPLAGVGHGAYRAEFGRAKEELWYDGIRFYRSQHQVYFTNAHSDLLEAVAEWGLLAVVVLLWSCWLVIRAVRRVAEDGDRSDAEMMWAGLVVLGIMAATNFPFRIALVAYPTLLFLSWIFAAEREAQQ